MIIDSGDEQEQNPTTPASEGAPAPAAVTADDLGADGEDAPEDSEPSAEELAELEFGLEKFKVPPKVKEHVESWRASQSRRDQELAEGRKALEADQRSHATHSQEHLRTVGELSYAERQLEAYEKFDWNKLKEENPEAAATASLEWRQWEAYRDRLQSKVAEIETSTRDAQRSTIVKRAEQAAEALARDIPGWRTKDASGKTVAHQVAEFALSKGLTPAQLGLVPERLNEAIMSEELGKLLHLAWQGSQLVAAKKAAATKARQAEGDEEPAKPAPTISKGRAPTTGLSDRLSVDDWMKQRDRQLKARD